MVTGEKIENLENPFPCRIAREKKIEAKYILLFNSFFFLSFCLAILVEVSNCQQKFLGTNYLYVLYVVSF